MVVEGSVDLAASESVLKAGQQVGMLSSSQGRSLCMPE